MNLEGKTREELIDIISQGKELLETLEAEYRDSRMNELALESLLKLSNAPNVSQRELLTVALDECIKITESTIGYLHFFDQEKQGLELYLWSEEVLKNCSTSPTPHYPLESAGIWADCVRTGTPAIHNDYENIPGKKGLPEGHFPLLRHMSIPIKDGDAVIGIVGVGNKAEDYDEWDVKKLGLFIESMWLIVKEKKKTYLIRTLMASTAEGIFGLDRNGICSFCNSTALALLGYQDESELIGKHVHDLVHHTHPDGDRYSYEDCPAFKAFVTEEPTHSGEEVFYRPDGSIVQVEYWAHPLRRDEDIVGSVVSFIDITEKKRTEAFLRKSEIQFRTLYELQLMEEYTDTEISDYVLEKAILLTDSQVGFMGFMDEEEQVFVRHSWSKSIMQGCDMDEKPTHFPIGDAGVWAEAVRNREVLLINDYSAPNPKKHGIPDGHTRLARLLCLPIFDGNNIVSLVAVANKQTDYEKTDVERLRLFCNSMWSILKKKRVERSIRRSLKEKEVLLREVHHRVKNNMQVINSLINLQSKYIQDKKSQDVFRESQSRIMSMALVHEQLYQTDDFSHINVETYVTNLLKRIGNTFQLTGSSITHSIDVTVSLEPDTLIPCGLILNELITNSFKHGFNGVDDGEISIHLRHVDDATIKMVYKDNGAGLPEGIDVSNAKGLGLRLVDTLVKQLEGTVDITRDKGSGFHFTFPVRTPSAGRSS